MSIKWIDEVPSLSGKVVLVRTGLNVPMFNGNIINDFRIRKALSTLTHLKERGARVVVISHIGREQSATLQPVAEELGKHLSVSFMKKELLDTNRLSNGDIVMLENLRQDKREIENDESFAQELAQLADIFVQDAFSVCHREHASIVSIPKYLPSYGGLLLKNEMHVLSQTQTPEHPALFILGGAKLATKEPLIRKFLSIYDKIFIGGILQNEILAASGNDVGMSVIENGSVPAEILLNDKIYKVDDVLIEHINGTSENVLVKEVEESDRIVDMGEASVKLLTTTLHSYKTILWNGPLGWYEKGYDTATIRLAHAIARTNAYTIIGGGDTIAVVQKEGLENKIDFVSTGGGAMLQFLQNGTLPGIDALKENEQRINE